jgi:hypothetical protein
MSRLIGRTIAPHQRLPVPASLGSVTCGLYASAPSCKRVAGNRRQDTTPIAPSSAVCTGAESPERLSGLSEKGGERSEIHAFIGLFGPGMGTVELRLDGLKKRARDIVTAKAAREAKRVVSI